MQKVLLNNWRKVFRRTGSACLRHIEDLVDRKTGRKGERRDPSFASIVRVFFRNVSACPDSPERVGVVSSSWKHQLATRDFIKSSTQSELLVSLLEAEDF